MTKKKKGSVNYVIINWYLFLKVILKISFENNLSLFDNLKCF